MPRKRKIPVAEEVQVEPPPVRPSKFAHELTNLICISQDNDVKHEKYYKEMQKQYSKSDHDVFMDVFIRIVQAAMIKDETDLHSNQILKFCAKFVTLYDVDSEQVTHPIISSTFNWLLNTTSPSIHVRYRVCQFVNLILNSMGADTSLDDAICDDISYYMLERIRDIAPNVRYQATLALQRLQEPENQECKIIRAYTFHLKTDVSTKVRQTVITSFGKTYQTIPHIIERIWDVDEKVRKFTYLQMGNYSVKLLKVVDRLKLLEQGLNDRADSVRKAVANVLLPQWIETYNRKYLAFVAALKIDANKEETERFRKISKMALRELFKKFGPEIAIEQLELLTEGPFAKCVPVEKISLEIVILWLAIAEYMLNNDKYDIDEFLPELSVMCKHIKLYFENLKPDLDKTEKMYVEFILLTLLDLITLYDYGDEVGRQNLKELLNWLLLEINIEEENIHLITELYEALVPNTDVRLQHYVDIINEIIETPKKHLEQAKTLFEKYLEKYMPTNDSAGSKMRMKFSSLKVDIMGLQEEEETFNNKNDYVNVKKVSEQLIASEEELLNLMKTVVIIDSEEKKELEELWKKKRINVVTINKCLQIAFFMVCTKNVKSLTPNVCALYKKFIRRHMESQQLTVREWALKCCTSYSMLYDVLSKDLFHELHQQFHKNFSARVWKVSIECIFELLDRYGFDHFDLEDKQEKTKRSGRQLFNNAADAYTDDESIASTQSGNGMDLIRLMMHLLETCTYNDILYSIKQGFCRLVLRGHYTSNDIISKILLKYFNPATEMDINQMLGIFFETLMKHKMQDILQPALLPTVTAIMEASYENPLAEIKPDNVLRFVIDSTRKAYCNVGVNIHNKLATSFMQIMTDNVTNKDLLKLLSKELLVLEISEDEELRTELKESVDNIVKHNRDAKIVKNLISFKEILDGVYKASETRGSSLASSKMAESVVTEVDWDKTVERNEDVTEEITIKDEDDKDKTIVNETIISLANDTMQSNNNHSNNDEECKDKSVKNDELNDSKDNIILQHETTADTETSAVVVSNSSISESSDSEVIPGTPVSNTSISLRSRRYETKSATDSTTPKGRKPQTPPQISSNKVQKKKAGAGTAKRTLSSSNTSSDSSSVSSPMRKQSRLTGSSRLSPTKRSSLIDSPSTLYKKIIKKQPSIAIEPLKLNVQTNHRTRSAVREEVKKNVVLTRRSLNELETSKRIPDKLLSTASSSLAVPRTTPTTRRSTPITGNNASTSSPKTSSSGTTSPKKTPMRSSRLAKSQPEVETRSLRVRSAKK